MSFFLDLVHKTRARFDALLGGTPAAPTMIPPLPGAEEARRKKLVALRCWGGAIVVASLCLAPLVLGPYQQHAIIVSMIFLLPAYGLNLILGYTGLLSLAQSAFFGIGAYTSALLALHFNTPFYANFVAAGLVAALIALPLGIPALRLRAVSFVMCTLGFAVIAEAISKNWISLTRGDMGLSGIPRPQLGVGGFSLSAMTTTEFYYLALAVALIMTAVFALLVSSAGGRSMIAIRDNETLAESVGIPTWKYKLAVFMISAGFAGFGGSLYAHYLTVVSPLTFQSYYQITILIIVLGGGAGTFAGPILGSLIFVALSEALRITPEFRMITYGLVLLFLIFFYPKGLAPLMAQVLGRRFGR